jgi:hypothetical protein
LCEAGTPREGERLLGHGRRTADLPWGARRHGGAVGSEHDVWIEHREQRSEVTDAERAALALTEAATQLSDRTDPVPDEIWGEAARHYDEPALAALIINIALINFWNRLNVTTRQVAGSGPR